MAKKIIGLVGAGSFGRHHARHLKAMRQSGRINDFYICDSDSDVLDLRKKENGTIGFLDYSDPDFANKVKGVVVAVPTTRHYEVTKFFLEKGIPCLTEKPLASNIKEASELVDLSQTKKTLLSTGFLFRYHPGVQWLRDNLQYFGRVLYMNFHNLKCEPPRQHDGSATSIGIHTIDICNYLWGAANFSKGKMHVPAEDTTNGDYASFMCLEYIADNGVHSKVSIYAFHSSITPFWPRTSGLAIVGTSMSARIDFGKRDSIEVWDGRIEVPYNGNKWFNPRGLREETFAAGSVDLVSAELGAFVDAVFDQKPVAVSARAGLEALEVLSEVKQAGMLP